MLFLLQNLLGSFAQKGLEIPPNDDAVETLLAAVRLCNLSSRRQLLTTAAKLQKDPVQVHLQAEIVHQQSVLLRFEGKIDESQRVIKEFFDGQYLRTKPASHPLLGLLHLSQANNLVYNFQFPDAHEQAKIWRPLTITPTKRQLDVLWEQIYLAGRIFRGEGRFEEARECFERCLTASGVPESKRILVKSTLADVYCELRYQHYQRNQERAMPDVQYLDAAKNIIRSEIERMRAHGLYSKGFRRLLLSSVEVEINEGQHSEAESLIKEVLAIYDKLTEPDVVDRLGHVRALIALARISSLSETEGRWSAALLQNAIYNPFEEEVFTCAVIYLFISFVRFELKHVDQSKEAFSHARDIIGKRRPQFLIPGIGTYLFDYIRLQLQSVAGYQLEEGSLA
jgi:tetratricopeptide (TPR) repeat protein